jgi:hypothetical protein
MDEAATCADSIRRIEMRSGNIMAGAKLAMHKTIDTYYNMAEIVLGSRWAGASSHASAIPRTTAICFGRRSKQRLLAVEPPSSPLPIGPGQHHYGFDTFRIASYQTTSTT